MNTVFAIGTFEVTTVMLGIPVALIFWLVMALIWNGIFRKTVWAETLTGTRNGKRLNAIGFGLLPALAVFLLFTEGTEWMIGRVSNSGWLKDTLFTVVNTEGQSAYRLGRFAVIGLIILFALLVLWLTMRRERIPDNGDVLLTAMTELGGLVTVMETLCRTDSTRMGPVPVMLIAGLILILIPLTVWTARNGRKKKNTAFIAVCWTVFLISAAAIAVREYTGYLGTDTVTRAAIRTGACLLAVKAAFCLGRVERNNR